MRDKYIKKKLNVKKINIYLNNLNIFLKKSGDISFLENKNKVNRI